MSVPKLKELIEVALKELNLEVPEFVLEHPTNLDHGDYSSNVALVLGKKLKKEPLSLAVEITQKLNEKKDIDVERVEVAGAGFINFYLSGKFFRERVAEILAAAKSGQNFGQNQTLKDRLILVEYTDPNPFKQFHIGHLMSNAVGESLSRIISFASANIKRVCYQGDAGRHVALAIWGIRFMKEPFPAETAALSSRIKYLGQAYALGASHAKDSPENEKEINSINQKIYDRSDEEINQFYDQGREWSLEYFEEIYKKLGTQFDQYFFESVAAPRGKEIVTKFLKKGVFEESEGAVVLKEEKSGLHTRVFINSQGLPTYEAKELALAEMKHEVFPYDLSIVVTANEVNDYFKVLLKALEFTNPKLAEKTKHISHGLLKLPTGKMSSRTGEVIAAEALLSEIENRAKEKMKDRGFNEEEQTKLASIIAVGAIKYSILKQKIGKDIIFDIENSLSFEGDSGPYLQYTHTRAESVLRKAKEEGMMAEATTETPPPSTSLERYLYRFPEIVQRALDEMEPHHLATYLIELAGEFNNFYAHSKIIDKEDKNSSYRLALTQSVSTVMKNGLYLLGIQVPEKM
ncbi:MAG TPA: arginine--tRNA ligase [Candidatus Paceibacterota bacterium]|nr:arginine--tRNA ligase [Candidatus Paceibacterota bacterium]